MYSRMAEFRGRVQALALTAGLLLGAGPAAAAIVWSAPVDSTGKASDVINTGELVGTATFGETVTVNGVTFEHVGLGMPNTSTYGVLSGYGHFEPDWDPDYRKLVEATVYVVPAAQLQFDLGVLPQGQYVLQLFMPQWDVNWATAFSLNGVVSNTVQSAGFLSGYSDYPARAKPQWVSATFDADGLTDYSLLTEYRTSYQVLSAFQLRTAPPASGAVPEPATWGLMIMGFGLAGAALRRRGARVQA